MRLADYFDDVLELHGFSDLLNVDSKSFNVDVIVAADDTQIGRSQRIVFLFRLQTFYMHQVFSCLVDQI